MLICYLVGCLLVAISIITVNSLHLQNFFLQRAMKHIGQKFSLSRKKRDFEHISLFTSLGCLVFPAELVCVHWQGPSVTGDPTSDGICSRLVTGAAFAQQGVVSAPITPLSASSARYTHCPVSASALLFFPLVFDLKSKTYQLTRIMERIIVSVASWHFRAGVWSGSWTE